MDEMSQCEEREPKLNARYGPLVKPQNSLTLINSVRSKWSDSNAVLVVINNKKIIYKNALPTCQQKSISTHFLYCLQGLFPKEKLPATHKKRRNIWEIVYCGRDNKCNHHFFPPLGSPTGRLIFHYLLCFCTVLQLRWIVPFYDLSITHPEEMRTESKNGTEVLVRLRTEKKKAT